MSGILVAPLDGAVAVEVVVGEKRAKMRITAEYARKVAAQLVASANVAEGKPAQSLADRLYDEYKRGGPFGGGMF